MGIACPDCGCPESEIDSERDVRVLVEGSPADRIRRRRRCDNCGRTWANIEEPDEPPAAR